MESQENWDLFPSDTWLRNDCNQTVVDVHQCCLSEIFIIIIGPTVLILLTFSWSVRTQQFQFPITHLLYCSWGKKRNQCSRIALTDLTRAVFYGLTFLNFSFSCSIDFQRIWISSYQQIGGQWVAVAPDVKLKPEPNQRIKCASCMLQWCFKYWKSNKPSISAIVALCCTSSRLWYCSYHSIALHYFLRSLK